MGGGGSSFSVPPVKMDYILRALNLSCLWIFYSSKIFAEDQDLIMSFKSQIKEPQRVTLEKISIINTSRLQGQFFENLNPTAASKSSLVNKTDSVTPKPRKSKQFQNI